MCCHPTRALFVVCGRRRAVQLWGQHENTRALAPGFAELSENVEYAEREDEFDRPALAALQPGEPAALGTAGLGAIAVARQIFDENDDAATLDILS